MGHPLGLVRRSADSHVRVTPLGSLYVFLRRRKYWLTICIEDIADRYEVGMLLYHHLLDQLGPHRFILGLDIRNRWYVFSPLYMGMVATTHKRFGGYEHGFAFRHFDDIL